MGRPFRSVVGLPALRADRTGPLRYDTWLHNSDGIGHLWCRTDLAVAAFPFEVVDVVCRARLGRGGGHAVRGFDAAGLGYWRSDDWPNVPRHVRRALRNFVVDLRLPSAQAGCRT